MDDADYDKFCILFELNRFEEATEVCIEALKVDPNDEFAHGNLAVGLLNQDKFEQAEVAVRKALSLNPDYAHGYKTLAYIQAQNLEYRSALKNILKAIELDPEDPEYYVSLGYRYLDLNKTQKAIEAEQQALKLDPENILAMICLMDIYSRSNQLDLCEEYCLKALEIEPDDPGILNNLAWLYGQKKKHRKSIDIYASLLANDPNNSQYQDNLHIAIGNYCKLRRKSFKKGLSSLPEHLQHFYKKQPSIHYKRLVAFFSYLKNSIVADWKGK